jgi:hypothetical protein
LPGRTRVDRAGRNGIPCSDKIHCPNCSHRKRGKDKTDYFHTMLAATIVAPGHNRVGPLEAEFIVPQDGHDKQDCESRADRRWLAAHGARYARFDPVYLSNDLFSRQPICQAVLDVGGDFLFVCKPGSHKAIAEFRAGSILDERIDRVRNGKTWVTRRYQWLGGVPLRGDEKAMTVNWLMIEISDDGGKVTDRNSFITDLQVTRENVAEVAAGGRVRWKIDNETFNVLKTKGDNLEHNFGHGKQNLASVLAILHLLAFACHTVCELDDRAWRAARRELVTRQAFLQGLRIITTYLVAPSWDDLLATLAFTRPPTLGPGRLREKRHRWSASTRQVKMRTTDFALSTGFLPSRVDPAHELNNATPSVQPHYRTLSPITGRSAPVLRFGTLILMGTAHLDVSLRIEATGSHVPRESQM